MEQGYRQLWAVQYGCWDWTRALLELLITTESSLQFTEEVCCCCFVFIRNWMWEENRVELLHSPCLCVWTPKAESRAGLQGSPGESWEMEDLALHHQGHHLMKGFLSPCLSPTRGAPQLSHSEFHAAYHAQREANHTLDLIPCHRRTKQEACPNVSRIQTLWKVEVLPVRSDSATVTRRGVLGWPLWTTFCFGSGDFFYKIWAWEHSVLYIKQKVNKWFQGIPLPHDQFKNRSRQTQAANGFNEHSFSPALKI